MIYNDYATAYYLKQFDINNVAFIAKLVADSYVFNANHKPKDIKNHVIVSAGCLNGNVMTTKSMSEIMQIMREKIREELQTKPQDVFEQINELYADDPEKIERLHQIITMPEDPIFGPNEFWRKLKEEGIKYFVVEYPVLNILCFHEEIDIA